MRGDLELQAPQGVDQLWRLHAEELAQFATVLVGPDDAMDLVVDAFVRYERHAERVEWPRAYLFRSVRNAAVDLRRSQRRRLARERTEPAVRTTELAEVDPRVLRAVRGLSPQQKAVVYLAYWEDLTEPDIAQLLNIGVGSVRRQLGRARTRLRKELS